MFCSPSSHSWPQPLLALRKRLTKKGPDPYTEDVDMKEFRECADEAFDSITPAPGRPPEVWEQHQRDGHMPRLSSLIVLRAWLRCSSF